MKLLIDSNNKLLHDISNVNLFKLQSWIIGFKPFRPFFFRFIRHVETPVTTKRPDVDFTPNVIVVTILCNKCINKSFF